MEISSTIVTNHLPIIRRPVFENKFCRLNSDKVDIKTQPPQHLKPCPIGERFYKDALEREIRKNEKLREVR
jgi:hypothetical protein